jgi:chromate transporter
VSTFALYLVLLRAMLLAFTGFGSLPQVREDLVVRYHAINDETLNRAVLVGRTTPGPAGVYVISVGYAVAGVPGAVVGWLALVTPAVLVIPLYGLAARAMTHRRTRGAIGALVLASAVLIVLASAPLVRELLARWAAQIAQISHLYR